MKKLLLLFSHKLNEEQIVELKTNFNIKTIISLNEEYQKIWSNVDINDKYEENLEKIKKYTISTLSHLDYVIIQGEWGYTYKMVNFCKENGLIPIYSFSKRNATEIERDGFIKKISLFKHIKFIKY